MDLTVRQNQNQVEIPEEFKDVFGEVDNLESVETPRLPQIKIIHAGQLFEMPDNKKIPEFEGIILDAHKANAWWEVDISQSEGNQIPDCFSFNGFKPEPNCNKMQNDLCATCQQNQYGSDPKGDGKACKNMRRMHILMEGSILPKRFTITPTSIRTYEEYITTLTDIGLKYPYVVTNFSLEKKTKGANVYSIAKFSKVRVLAKEELMIVGKLIKQYRDSARTQDIRADEYMQGNVSNGTVEKDDIPF